jgi:hypothetical protein
MAMLNLVVNGKSYAVPRRSVRKLLCHRELSEANAYAVQSSASREVFRSLADSLKSQSEISGTKSNAVSLWYLAREFFRSDVEDACPKCSVSLDHFATLPARVSELERQVSSSSSNWLSKIGDGIVSQEERLKSLRLGVEKLRMRVESEHTGLKGDLKLPQRDPQPSPSGETAHQR